ncbi:MAG: class I SAM-dependent methyltransferase [Alphaproteobacteria bacterium]|nr:SAM-dependent methyltransferase [Alphaproteobacteria bacterium]MDE2109941.1 class I SAM-dependent methyltransferase [Alphaproteobacteria bacterium]MDE2496094.1 class I SAM-dependent methyltransferase [Alphaproteobacteria bacterium]
MTKPIIEHVSDTARWAAWYRARETERRDALFRDPFASRLCGARGNELVANIPRRHRHEWSWITRTVLFDRIITEQVARGADMVVNLAAGLDARPYRMALPPSLSWIEVDLPQILDEKEQILAGEKPACILERVRMDLADAAQRRALFDRLSTRATNILVVSEGLLIYLQPDEVRTLAADLAGRSGFKRWVFDMASPKLLQLMRKTLHPLFAPEVPRFGFGPPEGPDFFRPYGWNVAEVRSMLHEAAKLHRLSLLFRLLALFPDTPAQRLRSPWSGVCLLARD